MNNANRGKWILLLAIVSYSLTFSISIYGNIRAEQPIYLTDISRLQTVKVHEIIKVRTENDVADALEKANREGRKISITGAGHSQGGQSFCQGCIVLDMKGFNQILTIDPEEKTIRVQSGTTWEQIQEAVNDHDLAVRVMQSSNIFTVGGSLGANAHGRDPSEGPIIDTVKSFRMMMADGTIMEASRSQNEDLFRLAIGGYGLFGVILDAELWLTDNEVYEEEVVLTDYKQFPEYVKTDILAADNTGLTIARLSTASASFLEEMYVMNYRRTDASIHADLLSLQPERHIERDKFIFGLSRKFDWGKTLSWALQKRVYQSDEPSLVTRNNAMRPGIQFLDYYSSQRTDILQEYFIPLDQFVSFVDGLREILKEEEANLVNVTIRYMPENHDAVLSYAQSDSLALVFLFNHRLSPSGMKEMEQVTRKMVDLALSHHGTYYLTYQLFPTRNQLQAAYPAIDEFFAQKKMYDPDERFMNEFYARYNTNDD